MTSIVANVTHILDVAEILQPLIQWVSQKFCNHSYSLDVLLYFRCRHRTLHLKNKTFLILENLFKTSGKTTKVLSFLKTPLPSMCVDRFASCENIVPRFQTSSILPALPTPRIGLFIPLIKLFYSQF